MACATTFPPLDSRSISTPQRHTYFRLLPTPHPRAAQRHSLTQFGGANTNQLSLKRNHLHACSTVQLVRCCNALLFSSSHNSACCAHTQHNHMHPDVKHQLAGTYICRPALCTLGALYMAQMHATHIWCNMHTQPARYPSQQYHLLTTFCPTRVQLSTECGCTTMCARLAQTPANTHSKHTSFLLNPCR